jgi:hypothetical protein
MLNRSILIVLFLLMLAPARGETAAPSASGGPTAATTSSGRVFEIRTYTTSQKLDVFLEFFRANTMKLFEKHGFEPIGFWIPQDTPRSQNTFVYVLAFPDRETARRLWDAFLTDPDWVKARTEFRTKNGPVTDKIESMFVSPTEFSPLK